MANDPCSEILDQAYQTAAAHLASSFVSDADLAGKIASVALCSGNRAGARFLLAAPLAKLAQPTVDIRKPFIDSYPPESRADAYGGRNYDEQFVSPFVTRWRLPCNTTTAFLTPAFRTKNIVLDLSQSLRGRPTDLYRAILEILHAVQGGGVPALAVLHEVVRLLIIERDEREDRLERLKKGLRADAGTLPLSSEDTVRLVEQHLALKHASRLPVLVVAAAYRAASARLGERVLRLNAHTAADSQTGALGDVEITVLDDDTVVTTYDEGEARDRRRHRHRRAEARRWDRGAELPFRDHRAR